MLPSIARPLSSTTTASTLVWGAPAQGFTRILDANGNRLLVRQDQVAAIDFSLCREEASAQIEKLPYHGRGIMRLRLLANGEAVIIRPYRHGGFFRGLTGDRFFTWPPRPFRELAITEELRRRGLYTVEIYAACVSRPSGPFYRAWLITRHLDGAEDLWSALQSGLAQRAGMEAVLRTVAKSIGAMHREGVYHADLNLRNILVRPESDGMVGYIIDFDKARVFLGRLPAPLAARNLARLQRSIRKLDPERRLFSAVAWKQLMSFYHAAAHA